MNLEQHRATTTVWDAARPWPSLDVERWGAAALAGGCAVAGLRRRDAVGWLLIAAGGALAWWAAGTLDQRKARRRIARATWPLHRREDWIGEASEASFPASDAPSWTPVTGANHGEDTAEG